MVSTDNYVLGAIGLALSLRKVKTQYPFILYLTGDISENSKNQLKELNIPYTEVKDLASVNKGNDDYKYSCINKSYIFTLTDYDKACWLDCDMLIFKNLDYLFDKVNTPAYMYLDNFLGKGNYPNAAPLNGWFYIISPGDYNVEHIRKRMKIVNQDEKVYWELDGHYLTSNDPKHDIFYQINSLSEIWHHGSPNKWWMNLSFQELQEFINDKDYNEQMQFLSLIY